MWKKVGIGLGSCLVVISLLVGGYLYWNQQALKKIKTSQHTVSKKIDTLKPCSFLLLGADTGAFGRVDRGNSDTMLVVTLNPQKQTTRITSIPRDALAEMVGDSTRNVQKINAAYHIGGTKMAKQTVSQFLNVPIDYTGVIGMGALVKVVDFVGGVTLKTEQSFQLDQQTIKQGRQHLNGKQALAYARMRYEDPRGDYGRQLRQQAILMAVAQKIIKPQYLLKLPQLIEALGPDLKTDLTTHQIVALVKNYRSCQRHVVTTQLIGKTAWINGSSYQIMPTAVLQKQSDQLRTSLGLAKTTLKNTATKLNLINQPFFANQTQITYDTGDYRTVFYHDDTY